MARIGLWGVSVAREGVPVLDGVNLAVEPGELVVITGARGAGQSTLLAVAATALPPGGGELEIEGRKTGALQEGSLPFVRRNIGYLPPEPPLARAETVLENVMLALGARGVSPDEAELPAREMLAALGIEHLAERRASALCVPERRLVATARALVGEPPVVVLDDPSVGLDEQDRQRLVAALLRLKQAGSAVLCGTSDSLLAAALAERGARSLRLEGGRVSGATALRLVDSAAPTERASLVAFVDLRPARGVS